MYVEKIIKHEIEARRVAVADENVANGRIESRMRQRLQPKPPKQIFLIRKVK